MAQQLEAPEYLSQDQVRDLMDKTRQSLVAEFPYLANHPQFDSDLNDAFSNFTKEQLQVGNDVEGSFSKTIHPMIQKWQSQGPRDIASSLQKEDAMANRMRSSGAASALDVPSMFPELTSPKSPYRSSWEARMNHDFNVAGRTPRLGATQLARKQFLQDELKRQWQADALPGMKPNLEDEKKIESELSQLDSGGQSRPAASALSGSSLPTPQTQPEEQPPTAGDFTGTGIFKDWRPHGLKRDSVIEIGGDTLTPNKPSIETPPDTGIPVNPPKASTSTSIIGPGTAAMDLRNINGLNSFANAAPSFASQVDIKPPDSTDLQYKLNERLSNAKDSLSRMASSGIGPGSPIYERTISEINDVTGQIKDLTKDEPSAAASLTSPSKSIDPLDGRTATNPTSGARVIYKNGQWQPL